jgi:hypothetical protein
MGLVNLVPGQYCNIHDVQTVIPESDYLVFRIPILVYGDSERVEEMMSGGFRVEKTRI